MVKLMGSLQGPWWHSLVGIYLQNTHPYTKSFVLGAVFPISP